MVLHIANTFYIETREEYKSSLEKIPNIPPYTILITQETSACVIGMF